MNNQDNAKMSDLTLQGLIVEMSERPARALAFAGQMEQIKKEARIAHAAGYNVMDGCAGKYIPTLGKIEKQLRTREEAIRNLKHDLLPQTLVYDIIRFAGTGTVLSGAVAAASQNQSTVVAGVAVTATGVAISAVLSAFNAGKFELSVPLRRELNRELAFIKRQRSHMKKAVKAIVAPGRTATRPAATATISSKPTPRA